MTERWIRRALLIVGLTLAWCGLWRDLALGTVIAGVTLAGIIVWTGTGLPARGTIRLGPLLRLIGIVLVDLAQSTVSVAAEVITPADRTDESIIAVDLPNPSRDHLLLLVIAVTLTPGTAVVDADPDSGRLYLHLLHDSRREATIEHVERLAEVTCQAFPVPIGATQS